LVDGPVVEWWIPDRVLSVKLNISLILLCEVELIWSNSNLDQTKIGLSHIVSAHDGLWVDSDWNSISLSKIEAIRLLNLGKFGGDWSWLVDDKVLEVSNGHIVVHKSKIIT
jgi:hypothetical protein